MTVSYHMRFSMRLKKERAMALVIVLGLLLVGIGIMASLVKLSGRLASQSINFSSQIQSELETDYFSNRVREGILRIVQVKTALTGGSSPATTLDGQAILNILKGQTCSSSPSASPSDCDLQIPIDSQETILSITCIGQGPNPTGLCDSSQILPKIYSFSVQTSDTANGTIASAQSEIQIQRAGLNAYAFFVKNETQPFIAIGPSDFNGIFGLNFASTVAGGGAPPAQRLKFIPQNKEINFRNVFMTNLPNFQSQSEGEELANVYFEQGYVSTSASMSFDDLNSLHGELIDRARSLDSANQIKWDQEPGCSKITLNSDESFEYEEFADKECKISLDEESTTFAPLNNQSFYARGPTVIIDSASPSDPNKLNNIAIVADGNVELRSSIIRDPERDALAGYPVIMAKGDLIISGQMKSLLPGNPVLSAINTDVTAETPTIQIDLSYISVASSNAPGGSTPPGQITPPSFGGSIRFDPSLTQAASPGGAIDLGRAQISGLFITERTPVSRRLFPPSNEIDGFSNVSWEYPSALSAVNTDWFRTQLGGGALRSVITRYEKKMQDIQQALKAFPEQRVVVVVEPDQVSH